MDTMADTSWDALRRKTRQLETTIDARLTTYSSLASQIARAADPSAGVYADHTTLDMDGSSRAHDNEHVELESELDKLINQLSEAVDALTAKLDDPETPAILPITIVPCKCLFACRAILHRPHIGHDARIAP